MKYRLGKDLGKSGLKSFIKARGYVIDEIAYRLNYTPSGLQYILTGRTKNPKKELLERLSEILDLSFGYDDGLFFEEISESNTVNEPTAPYGLSPEQQQLLESIEKIPPAAREQIENLIKEISKLRKSEK